MIPIRTLAVFMMSLGLAVGIGAAQAQTASGYPQKPVRMIIPFAPGGASDFAGRIVSPRLSEVLGQQIVIDNRAGASGNIGMEAAAKAPADGYTIFLGNIGTISINPAVFPSLPVNPAKDFIPVSLAQKIDWQKTYINCFTAGIAGLRRSRMPMVLPTEDDCVKAALSMCGRAFDQPKRVVRIESTLHLTRCWVSDALLRELPAGAQVVS